MKRGSTHTCFVSNNLLFFIRMQPNIRTRIRHDHTQLHLTFSEDFHWQEYPLHGNLRDIKLVHEIKFNINYSGSACAYAHTIHKDVYTHIHNFLHFVASSACHCTPIYTRECSFLPSRSASLNAGKRLLFLVMEVGLDVEMGSLNPFLGCYREHTEVCHHSENRELTRDVHRDVHNYECV